MDDPFYDLYPVDKKDLLTVSPVCRTAFLHESEEQVCLQAAEEQRAFLAEQVDDEVALVPAYVVAEAV